MQPCDCILPQQQPPGFSVKISIPKAKLNNCTVAAITTSTAHEESKYWALLKCYWGQQAVLLTWNVSHCRCWCHFFYGSGMARPHCLTHSKGKTIIKRFERGKVVTFILGTLIKIPQLAMTLYRFIACVLSPPLLCFIAPCISDTPISLTGHCWRGQAPGSAHPSPNSSPAITVQRGPLACAFGNSRWEFLR